MKKLDTDVNDRRWWPPSLRTTLAARHAEIRAFAVMGGGCALGREGQNDF